MNVLHVVNLSQSAGSQHVTTTRHDDNLSILKTLSGHTTASDIFINKVDIALKHSEKTITSFISKFAKSLHTVSQLQN